MSANTGSWSGQRRSFPPRIAKKILARAQHRCQIHGPNCIGLATQADHIKPHAEGGSDDISNGQAACAPCHDEKTRQEQARGRARIPKRQRPPQRHPGLRRVGEDPKVRHTEARSA